MEPKGCQSEPRELQKHLLRKRIQKGCQGDAGAPERVPRKRPEHHILAAILVQNPFKMQLKIHSKIKRGKAWKRIPKGFQNGAEIDAKTHLKAMPKLVSKKLRKIMKIHVFLKRKTMQIHWMGHRFWRFCKVGARTENSLKIDQKCDENPYTNLWQFDTNFIVEKAMPET